MRQAGGWVLGLTGVLAIAGGGLFALRPLFNRETVLVSWVRDAWGPPPTEDAIASGAAFAIQEADGRAGKFRIRMTPSTSAIPSLGSTIWFGSTSHPGHLEKRPSGVFLVKVFGGEADGEPCDLQVLPRTQDLGAAAAGWVKTSGAQHVVLLRDDTGRNTHDIAEQFAAQATRCGVNPVPLFSIKAEPATDTADRILATRSDLVFCSGEDAPYSETEAIFSSLRTKGYAGTLLVADSEPEVSFLAIPSRFPEGSFLLSPIGPPSGEFTARYEPRTNRRAGPHAWPGYLAMKSVMEVIGRSTSNSAEEFRRIAAAIPGPRLPCWLYVYRKGHFEFVQPLN